MDLNTTLPRDPFWKENNRAWGFLQAYFNSKGAVFPGSHVIGTACLGNDRKDLS